MSLPIETLPGAPETINPAATDIEQIEDAATVVLAIDEHPVDDTPRRLSSAVDGADRTFRWIAIFAVSGRVHSPSGQRAGG